jgi:ADP-heptose:LPS heptosyltransferase
MKILIEKLNSYGDCVSCTPIPRALKDKYPDCHITWMTSEPYEDVFSMNPHIDTLKVTPPTKAHNGPTFKAYDAYLARELSTHIDEYDELYELSTLTFWGEYRRTGISLADHYAAMAGVFPLGDRRYEVYINEEVEAEKLNASHPELTNVLSAGPIVIHGSGGWDQKVIPWFKWLDVIDYIKGYINRPIVFIGAEDARVPEHIGAELTRRKIDWHQAIGLSIKNQYYLIDQSYMFIGPDSGPMHLTGATSTPIVAYYAGTSQFVAPPRSEKWVTMQSDASCGAPCGTAVCRTHELCSKLIEPWHIAQAVLKLNAAICDERPIQRHFRGLNETQHYFYRWENVSTDGEYPEYATWMDQGISLDPNWKPNAD